LSLQKELPNYLNLILRAKYSEKQAKIALIFSLFFYGIFKWMLSLDW